MKHSIIIFALSFLIINVHAQENSLQLGNGVISIANGAVLTINQASASGITKNTGYICTKNENDRVAWITNNKENTYVIPFATEEGEAIPVSFEKTSGGNSVDDEGTILVSTYHTAPNNIPYPSNSDAFFSDVTNTKDASGNDISMLAADRFWLICFLGYNTNPVLTASLGYDAAGGNNDLSGLTEDNLYPVYWNGSYWAESTTGIAEPLNDRISGIDGINASTAWMLSTKSSSLPVTLLSFKAECNDKDVELSWSTASEVNSDLFIIERSTDYTAWTMAGSIPASGFSNETKNYYFTDMNAASVASYYRLTETDYDGTSITFDPVQVDCQWVAGETELTVIPGDNEVNIQFSGFEGDYYSAKIVDMNGRILSECKGNMVSGMNQATMTTLSAAEGIYMVVVEDGIRRISKKIIL